MKSSHRNRKQQGGRVGLRAEPRAHWRFVVTMYNEINQKGSVQSFSRDLCCSDAAAYRLACFIRGFLKFNVSNTRGDGADTGACVKWVEGTLWREDTQQ